MLTTQYLEEADRLADHIVVLNRGRVAARGTPAELKRIVGGKVVTATIPTHQLGGLPFGPETENPVDGGRVRVDVSDLDVASPSLDDVFTHLTHDGATP